MIQQELQLSQMDRASASAANMVMAECKSVVKL